LNPDSIGEKRRAKLSSFFVKKPGEYCSPISMDMG